MKIPLTKEIKVKLLKAIQNGVFDSKDFPELTRCGYPAVINVIRADKKILDESTKSESNQSHI